MSTHFRIAAPFIVALAVAACDGQSVTEPGHHQAPTTLSLSATDEATQVLGETGPGSTYALYRPDAWNGSLVLFAHGYVQPFLDPDLPTTPLLAPMREYLLSEGYGVAYSSYSETGYAVKDGAQRTHQLRGLFTSEFGPVDRTFVWGNSMGGLIAELMNERYPAQYDGTLATCGVVAGGLWNATYVANFRVLFDVFYPGVLPGSLFEVPQGEYVIGPSAAYPGGNLLFQRIAGALVADPMPAAQMAMLDQVQLAYTSGEELIEGFLLVLAYQINGAEDLSDRLNGKSFFDNRETVYSGPLPEALLHAVNAQVARYDADPSAVRYFERWYEPTGALDDPVVTLHTTRDPLVPLRGEDIFADVVEGAGAAGLLLQREEVGFGHCALDPARVINAFATLAEWVETGVRPAS